jgi:hypothetical protein
MNQALNTEQNISSPDDLYDLLINAHRDLDDQQIRLLDASLILLLSNHIGSIEVVKEAIRVAKECM